MTRIKAFILLLFLTGTGVFLRTYYLRCFNSTWIVVANGMEPPAPRAQPRRPPKPSNESLCSCAKCLTEDEELYRHRLENFGQPFLTQNYSLPEAHFNWWKRLQNERGSLSTFQDTVKQLFEVFPHVPDVVEPSPDRCRTCAVVGNSANLKGSHYGKIIDSQNVVIRMNFGPTKGYEDDIGTKTTHRALYPESATNLDNTTHLVLFPFKIKDLEWLYRASTTQFTGASYAPVISKIRVNKSLVMIVNPALMRYAHEKLLDSKGQYSSTGFMTLVLALHMCDEVHVFGFGADSEGNWSHYWQVLHNVNMVNVVHPVKHEYEVIQRLAQEGKFQFYKGV